MQMHLLKTKQIPEPPENINVLADWGSVTIRTSEGGADIGEHIMIEAEEEAIRSWLGKANGVWVGQGHPMMQEFEIMHIREDDDADVSL